MTKTTTPWSKFQDIEKAVVIFRNNNRQFVVISMKDYAVLKKSGVHKSYDNCKDAAYSFVARRGLLLHDIVHA